MAIIPYNNKITPEQNTLLYYAITYRTNAEPWPATTRHSTDRNVWSFVCVCFNFRPIPQSVSHFISLSLTLSLSLYTSLYLCPFWICAVIFAKVRLLLKNFNDPFLTNMFLCIFYQQYEKSVYNIINIPRIFIWILSYTLFVCNSRIR